MINGEDYAICYFWVSRKPIKQPKTQESTRTRISSWLEASEEALVMTVSFFRIFSPWRRVKFSTPLTLGLTMGLASADTMWQKWHVPLLSRRDYEQMLCCPALFLLPWNQRNRPTYLTIWSRGTADPWWTCSVSENQTSVVANAEILGSQHDPLQGLQLPGGVRVPAHPLFGVVLNSISPSPTIYMAQEHIKIKR